MLTKFHDAIMTSPGANELTHWGWDEIDAIFKCIFLNDNV